LVQLFSGVGRMFMKKVLVIVAIGFLMIGSYAVGRRHSTRPVVADPGARRILYWVDPMHPDYKSDHAGIAPDCGMPLEPVYADSVSVSLNSSAPAAPGAVAIDVDKQQIFGIRVAAADRTSGAQHVRVLGRVVPDDTRVYRVNMGTDGFVKSTQGDAVGTFVKKDQKLAVVYSPEFLNVAGGFLSATERTQNRGVPESAASFQGIAGVQNWSDRLRNLGMSDMQIEELTKTRRVPEDIYVVSPVDGFILERDIAASERFERHSQFYRIADLSHVWIVADIFSSEAQNFRPGTVAHVTLTNSGKKFTARVSDVLPEVDPTTRTLKLRLETDNPGFALRPEMFVDVELPVSASAALTVPLDSLIDTGREQRVFVERTAGVFEPRPVETGWRSSDRVQITSGLNEGERVVVSGTFLVDSESRLKSGQAEPKTAPLDKVQPKSDSEPRMTAGTGKVKDAACGMSIDPAKATAEGHTITRNGVTYYFCSNRCKRNFSAQPEKYLASSPPGHRP